MGIIIPILSIRKPRLRILHRIAKVIHQFNDTLDSDANLPITDLSTILPHSA